MSTYYAIKANGSRIAQTSGEHLTQDAEANARLIAAAPELLAFAQMIANGGILAADADTIESEARAILRKATGQQ